MTERREEQPVAIVDWQLPIDDHALARHDVGAFRRDEQEDAMNERHDEFLERSEALRRQTRPAHIAFVQAILERAAIDEPFARRLQEAVDRHLVESCGFRRDAHGVRLP